MFFSPCSRARCCCEPCVTIFGFEPTSVPSPECSLLITLCLSSYWPWMRVWIHRRSHHSSWLWQGDQRHNPFSSLCTCLPITQTLCHPNPNLFFLSSLKKNLKAYKVIVLLPPRPPPPPSNVPKRSITYRTLRNLHFGQSIHALENIFR